MDIFYTNERNTLILIALMKEHGVRKIVVSPGSTNSRFVASVQHDSFFELYSVIDERSAAYMACGLAAETGEPVALSCTGATASRNYIPALTEAFYRRLPILAITSTQHSGRIGNHLAQAIDRSKQLKDMVYMSLDCPTINNGDDELACTVNINKALLELKHNGGGPVHINLATTYSKDFSVKELPKVRVINRITYEDKLPTITKGKIGIFVGAHRQWSDELVQAVERFCEKYNAVVLCDQTSGYRGKYNVLFNLIHAQSKYDFPCNHFDLIIHIGEVSGAYPTFRTSCVWRVNRDGIVRDTFKRLKYVFEMSEEYFFNKYNELESDTVKNDSFIKEWRETYDTLYNKIPENLPFSNPWIAMKTAPCIPKESVIHLGILSSLRSWNFFNVDKTVYGYSNTGGFGIDGGLSSLIGASLANPKKLYFGMIGDLAFFYDMNVLGNRNVRNNIRILLINNGKGTEFRNYNHPAAIYGEDTDSFIAAAGHYGNKSPILVKNYVESLGYEYLCASNKEEYLNVLPRFTTPEITSKPMVLEVFTNSDDESDALKIINNLEVSKKAHTKDMIKGVLGEEGIMMVKKLKSKIGK